jgi:Ras-related GTP-binding protein C/D
MRREEFREKELPEPSYHPTSIYDHTIYEALSKIFQRVTLQVPYLTQLLDNLMNSCRFDKVYIFDVISKLFIASDSTPVDLLSYELCSDMIDVFVDMSYIYGREEESHNYSINFDE